MPLKENSILQSDFDTCTYEGTKVHNPRRYTQCISLHTLSCVCTLYVYSIHVYTRYCIYIRGLMGECTGKYTEVWQKALRVQR